MDVNVRYKSRMPKEISENILVFPRKGKCPTVKLVICDYKTADQYGIKKINIKNKRLFDELMSLNLKHDEFVFKTRDGKQASTNYMNVMAIKDSLHGYGEGKLAKTLVKHCIETKDFNRLEQVSRDRGTSLQTLITSYNVFDN